MHALVFNGYVACRWKLVLSNVLQPLPIPSLHSSCIGTGIDTGTLPIHPLCAQHLAKEVVQSRHVVGRLYTNKAQLMSVGTSLTEQLGGWIR